MNFQIQPSSVFDASIGERKKTHYKKDTKGWESFLSLVEAFFLSATELGHKCPLLTPEGWPKNTFSPDWLFTKYRFKMPHLSGDPGQGRIMVAINMKLSLVYPILAYTHKQYGDRPPDKEIGPLLQAAIRDVQAMMEEAAKTEVASSSEPKQLS